MADKPTTRIRVNQLGAAILRGWIQRDIDAWLQLRRSYIDMEATDEIPEVDTYLAELRILSREVGRTSAEMGWIEREG